MPGVEPVDLRALPPALQTGHVRGLGRGSARSARMPATGRCGDLLTGSYDYVDRLVLNAYVSLGHSPGGFRVWWRRWHEGSDQTLDNAHLMRMAAGSARRCGRGTAHNPGDRRHTGAAKAPDRRALLA
jgi:hypothetical protein